MSTYCKGQEILPTHKRSARNAKSRASARRMLLEAEVEAKECGSHSHMLIVTSPGGKLRQWPSEVYLPWCYLGQCNGCSTTREAASSQKVQHHQVTLRHSNDCHASADITEFA